MSPVSAPELFPDVSRETLDRLQCHLDLLGKWSAAINLVGRETLASALHRHVADSAQLLPIVQDARPGGPLRWCDIGTGAGFPGLVVAILAADTDIDLHLILVESDARKAAFLRHAAHVIGIKIEIMHARIERLPGLGADVISARALAPLHRLLEWSAPHLAPGGLCLFPKGHGWRAELDTALASWTFRLQNCPSHTSQAGVILKIEELQRV